MTNFSPNTLLTQISNYKNELFKNSCKELFRINDLYDNVDGTTKIVGNNFNYFIPFSLELQDYVTNYTNQGNEELNSLLFANLKFLKLEIDRTCTDEHITQLITNLKTDLLNNDGHYIDIVDEEGEVHTYIVDEDGYTYYTDQSHEEYCIQILFKIALKNIREMLGNYSSYFDDNYSLLPTIKAESVFPPLANLSVNQLTFNCAISIPHKLYWDEEIIKFESFFSKKNIVQNITLMNGEVDRVKILSILKEVFLVGNFGGMLKNDDNTGSVDNRPFMISEGLKWNGGAPLFANTFSELIKFENRKSTSNTTVFCNFSKTGVRDTIVKVLYFLFYIDKQTGERIAPSYLKQAFKDYEADQGL